MAENKKPAIRFKGFTDAWEQRKLGDLGSFKNGMNFSKDAMDKGYPFVNLQNIFGRNVIDTDNLGLAEATDTQLREYNLLQGDVLFVRSSVKLEGVGEAALVPKFLENTTYSGFIIRFRDESNMDDNFKRFVFGIKFVRDQIMAKATNSANKNISQEALNNLEVLLPSNVEQKEIGSFFSNLDTLITLHQRKCETLQKLKKSMLQKMFPKNGSLYPEIRFAGFTDAWEQREFSKQYVKVSEKNDLSFGTDKIISVANMYFKEDTKESSDDYMKTYNVMRLGDIAFEGNKSKNFAHGRFVENTIGDGIVSHVFDVFRPIADYDLLFWKYIINNEGVMGRIMTRCTKASTMMTNLVADDFLKEKIAVPSLEEQRQIGSFLNGLDNLITLHQRKLETLKKIKKSMLQKMFI